MALKQFVLNLLIFLVNMIVDGDTQRIKPKPKKYKLAVQQSWNIECLQITDAIIK